MPGPYVASGGAVIPVMRTAYGLSQVIAVSSTPTTAAQLNVNRQSRVVRLWAVGCPVWYIFGPTNAASAAAGSGYIGQDRYIETYYTKEDSWFSARAVSGTGSLVLEILD